MRLLHISDLHFGTEQPEVVQALHDFAHQTRPAATIVSGDITQRATDAQFEAFARFAITLPRVPTLILPGNHDIPLYDLVERFTSPFSRYRECLASIAAETGCIRRPRDDASWLDPVLEVPGVVLLGVNTTRSWRQQNGAISARQLRQVEQLLQAAPPSSLRIVVTHHPLAVLRPEDAGDRPLRHAQARRRWSAAGADLLLSGHVHVPAVLPVDGPPIREASAGAGLDDLDADAQTRSVVASDGEPAERGRTWAVSAGSGVSARTVPGFPNSVNVLVQAAARGPGERPTLGIERHDFDPRTGRFESAAQTTLAR